MLFAKKLADLRKISFGMILSDFGHLQDQKNLFGEEFAGATICNCEPSMKIRLTKKEPSDELT